MPLTYEKLKNERLVWGDEIWHVSAMHIRGKGFMVDYCVEIEPQRVKSFIEKWEPLLTSEENVSEEARQQIERENPLEINFLSYYMLNGRTVRQKTGLRMSYIPDYCLPGGVENSEKALAMIEHYNLDPTKAWSFHRHSCPWATAGKPMEIKSFSLRLERHPETIQGIYFKNPVVGEVIPFTHLISGTEHKLTVLGYEKRQLSSDSFAHEEYEYPTYCTAMTYTIEPSLSQAAYSICDCVQNEQPKHRNGNPYKPKEACSIGIIAGADGPTAIAVLQKNSKRKIHTVLSALHFEPVNEIEWKIEFQAKMVDDVEITLI